MKAVPLISSEVKVLFKKVSIFPSSLLMLRVNNGFLTSVPQTFFLGRIFLPSSPLNILSFSLRTLLFWSLLFPVHTFLKIFPSGVPYHPHFLQLVYVAQVTFLFIKAS